MRGSFFLMISALVFAGGCFPRHPGPHLTHFASQAPQVGDPAPPFVLYDLSGERVELQDLIGEKPIVLRFGSHSCPVYRYRRFSMTDLYDEFSDRVHFLLVYTVEAHPVGSVSPYTEEEWDTWWNRATGVRVPQPEDAASRREQARASHERLKLKPPMVVDEMTNEIWKAYGSASSPAFVIDREGRIAARQVWVEPKGLRQVLEELLEGGSK